MKKILMLLLLVLMMGCASKPEQEVTTPEVKHVPNVVKVKLIHQYYQGQDEDGKKHFIGIGGFAHSWALLERQDTKERISKQGIFGTDGEVFAVDIAEDEEED